MSCFVHSSIHSDSQLSPLRKNIWRQMRILCVLVFLPGFAIHRQNTNPVSICVKGYLISIQPIKSRKKHNVSVLSQGEQSLELNTLLHRSLAFCRSLFFFNRTNRHLNTSMMLSIDFCRVVVRLSVILWPRLFDSHLPNNLNKYI